MYMAGMLLATHLFLLSAETGITAVYVRPSGLQFRNCRLVMVPALFFPEHVGVESVVARVVS